MCHSVSSNIITDSFSIISRRPRRFRIPHWTLSFIHVEQIEGIRYVHLHWVDIPWKMIGMAIIYNSLRRIAPFWRIIWKDFSKMCDCRGYFHAWKQDRYIEA
jgi:hypothetical protein